MTSIRDTNKALLQPLCDALYDFEPEAVKSQLKRLTAQQAQFKLAHPFGIMAGADEFYAKAYAPLLEAWPDMERRQHIYMAGTDHQGADWVGCGGYYLGTFEGPWLDIPPTGHLVHMRFHEFFRIEDGQIVEFQALWDIPEVMMQANAWPMAPTLGREWHIPGPASQDGLVAGPYDQSQADASCALIVDMLEHMKRYPSQGGPEVMEMPRFWHPKMTWYGPSGIGTGRGIAGFRHWHQEPFLNGMPDRGQFVDEITYHFFGDKNYAAVTGWPNMIQTITHDGWMGIVPAGKKITMKSLDFWRMENGLIRENWVMVDLLDAYHQLGVDVFARLREFNKVRSLARVPLR